MLFPSPVHILVGTAGVNVAAAHPTVPPISDKVVGSVGKYRKYLAYSQKEKRSGVTLEVLADSVLQRYDDDLSKDCSVFIFRSICPKRAALTNQPNKNQLRAETCPSYAG
jgi:hypothetical protein